VQSSWLSWLIFFPLLSAVAITALPRLTGGTVRMLATIASLAELAFSLPLWWRYRPGEPGFQFTEQVTWLPSLGATYHLGADGVSVLLALLTTVLTPIVIVGAWSAVEKREREFYALLLALRGRHVARSSRPTRCSSTCSGKRC
jgi:NADH-quinone oxidoreductase subunit M